MQKTLKAVILVPYVGSNADAKTPEGEGKIFFDEYFFDAEVIQVLGSSFKGRMYVKDGIGMYIIGEGKTNAAMYTTALLSSSSFDFKDTKFVLCGCCGCAKDAGVVGDVYLVTSSVDYELGHNADVRDGNTAREVTWYPNVTFNVYGHIDFDEGFIEKAHEWIKNEPVKTTENALHFMAKSFNNAAWATRQPKIIKATSVTSDSYWKGDYAHNIANYITNYYKCKNPYYATAMEDLPVGIAFKNFNKLKDLLVMRYAVNTDVFMAGQTPENLWSEVETSFGTDGLDNFDDLFPVASRCAHDICWKIIHNLI